MRAGDEPTSIGLETGDIRVEIVGHSGGIKFWDDSEEGKSKLFMLEFIGIEEQTPEGDRVKDRDFNTLANQDFTFGELTDFDFPSLNR